MVALTIPAIQELVIVEVKNVYSNPVQNTGNMSQCRHNHEEADSRIITEYCLQV